jgi:hypothetical protein
MGTILEAALLAHFTFRLLAIFNLSFLAKNSFLHHDPSSVVKND